MNQHNENSKGMSVHWPGRVELPDIDFVTIAEKASLQLSTESCEGIKYVLREYISNVKSWEIIPLSRERKAFLKSIKDACEVLESVFELDECGTFENFDPLLFFVWKRIVPHVECSLVSGSGDSRQKLVVNELKLFDSGEKGQLRLEAKTVADYLAICRKKVQQELDFSNQAGNRKKYAITRCLKLLHQVYSSAGGKGRGCWRAANGDYRGPFLVFAKELLERTEYPYPESALGNHIVKIVKSGR